MAAGFSHPSPDTYVYVGTLATFIKQAYGVQGFQIDGASKWLDHDMFEIQAKTVGRASPEQVNLMFRTLLAERFKLSLHSTAKQQSVYALTAAKGGPKLESSADTGLSGGPHMIRGGMDMPTLAQHLSAILGRNVIDETKLSGTYKVSLRWSADGETDHPALFTAIQEQLGLRLKAGKARVEVLVIDHAEQPSEN